MQLHDVFLWQKVQELSDLGLHYDWCSAQMSSVHIARDYITGLLPGGFYLVDFTVVRYDLLIKLSPASIIFCMILNCNAVLHFL